MAAEAAAARQKEQLAHHRMMEEGVVSERLRGELRRGEEEREELRIQLQAAHDELVSAELKEKAL